MDPWQLGTQGEAFMDPSEEGVRNGWRTSLAGEQRPASGPDTQQELTVSPRCQLCAGSQLGQQTRYAPCLQGAYAPVGGACDRQEVHVYKLSCMKLPFS